MILSASRLGLAKHCVAWLDLPCVDTTSEAAAIGTRVHAWIAAALTGAELPELCATGASMAPRKALEWFRGEIAGSTHVMHVETAYASNGRQAKALEIKDRQYPVLEPGWVVGTADVVVDFGEGASGIVVDWKTTTSHTGLSASAGEAHTNRQLAFLAHCCATIYGWRNVKVVLAHLSPSGFVVDEHWYDALALDLAAADIFASAAKPRVPRPGMHCSQLYCPAIGSCPSHKGIIRSTTQDLALPRSAGEITSAQQCLALYAQAQAAKKASEQYIAMCEQYVRTNGEQAYEGYALRLSEGHRETIKGTNAGRLVEIIDRYAPGRGATAVTVASSKAEVERSIKASGGTAAKVKACLNELRDAGYMQTTTFETLKWEESK